MHERKPIDLERAYLNPSAVFSSPQELAGHPALTRARKLELLRRWAQDARDLAVAEEEGMGGGEPAREGRVLRLIQQLESDESNEL